MALAAIVADLRARMTALEQAEAARVLRARLARLKRGDRVLLGKLLPVLASLLGSDEFLARELAETEHPAFRELLAGRSNESIGWLLSNGAGIPIGGLVIVARGKELGVRKYAVEWDL